METFEFIWQLLAPLPKFYSRRNKCFEVWQNLTIDEQRAIYNQIKARKESGQFVNNNPYFALIDNLAPQEPKEMDFDAYYKKYGTTEDTDGWKRKFLQDEGRTIYVK